MSPERVLSFVHTYEEPCVSASDVATNFDVTNNAARYRLKQLEESGRLNSKVVGSSAKVWYAVG